MQKDVRLVTEFGEFKVMYMEINNGSYLYDMYWHIYDFDDFEYAIDPRITYIEIENENYRIYFWDFNEMRTDFEAKENEIASFSIKEFENAKILVNGEELKVLFKEGR